jgi:hypothetical protein
VPVLVMVCAVLVGGNIVVGFLRWEDLLWSVDLDSADEGMVGLGLLDGEVEVTSGAEVFGYVASLNVRNICILRKDMVLAYWMVSSLSLFYML